MEKATTAGMNDLFAALDLGSNSFHLLLARRAAGGFETVERLKEKVQLLAGFDQGRLHPAAFARGQACLTRFAQRLAAVPREQLYMVGTHALREAANRDEFAAMAQRIMGIPLEVVSGREEARLVNLAVAHHLPRRPGERRLVVDVGGGSTELAWSGTATDAEQPSRLGSFAAGCVALNDAFFAPGVDQGAAYRAAREHAMTALGALPAVPAGTDVIGTSGTVESVQSVLAANGWGEQWIDRDGLAALTGSVASGRWLVEAGLPGLAPERVDIFAAGLAVVDALFARLDIERMRFADVSLQDGVLCRQLDLPGVDQDPRRHGVLDLQQRFAIDTDQAARVRETALALYDGVAHWWPAEDWRELLGWAADLHEIGLAVSSSHYHRHGAYLLRHADMPALSRTEQAQLALLVRGHRRGFPGLAFRAYDETTRQALIRLLALLRLAVIFERSHRDADSPTVTARASEDGGLLIELPTDWLSEHPLSAAELEVEYPQLARVGIRLEVHEVGVADR